MNVFPLLHPDWAMHDAVAEGQTEARSLGDLMADAEALAERLPDPSPGAQVALICTDRYHFTAGLLAIWQRGHIAALPPNGQSGTVTQLLANPAMVALLHDTDADGGIDVRTVAPAARSRTAIADWAFPAERPLVTVYTSGSTGDSRPQTKTAGQLLGEVASHVAAGWLLPGDFALSTVPAHHLYGLLFGVLLPLRSRATFHRLTPLHAETLAGLAQRPRVVLISTPAQLAAMQLLPSEPLSNVVRVLSSTAPLPEVVATALAARGLEITEIFGSSETGGIATRQRPGLPVWRPLPGVEIAITHAEADGGGQLVVDSPFLPPEMHRPMATGDRIRLDGAGGFHHLGRLDDVVKVGGTRVSLGEMEQRLRALDGVGDAAVRAEPVVGLRGHRILAAVVAPDWTAPMLRTALSAWFATHTLPRRIAFVGALPRDANGKVSKAAFDALFAATVDVSFTPMTEVDPAAVRYEVAIPQTLAAFVGHFPGNPVLPGVAQLAQIVLPIQRALRPEWSMFRRLTRLKFRRIIRPGDTLQLMLRIDDPRRLCDFTLSRDGDVCAMGCFHFGDP